MRPTVEEIVAAYLKLHGTDPLEKDIVPDLDLDADEEEDEDGEELEVEAAVLAGMIENKR